MEQIFYAPQTVRIDFWSTLSEHYSEDPAQRPKEVPNNPKRKEENAFCRPPDKSSEDEGQQIQHSPQTFSYRRLWIGACLFHMIDYGVWYDAVVLHFGSQQEISNIWARGIELLRKEGICHVQDNDDLIHD